jgi:hypothetical protein
MTFWVKRINFGKKTVLERNSKYVGSVSLVMLELWASAND